MTANWGRWGADDERGALNLITPSVTRAAAALVTDGIVHNLAQPISAEMNLPAHRPGPQHFMNRDGGDYAAGARRPGGFQFAEDTVLLPLHVGTHVDALCHCWHDDRMFNGFAGAEVRSTGARRLGVERIGAIVTRGVLLDFVALTGAPLLDGFAIGPDLLAAAIDATGTVIAPGDAVLLRTGWQESRGAGPNADYNAEPGLDLAAAQVLAAAAPAIIGADNYAVEVLPFAPGTVFPVHQCLIRDHGIPLLEGLVLAPLAAHRRPTFLLTLAALPIQGATGSPVVPVAVT
jgi:kynurenine formamidase